MRRRTTMHVLLQTNIMDDILSILEPWSSAVGMVRADDARNGVRETWRVVNFYNDVEDPTVLPLLIRAGPTLHEPHVSRAGLQPTLAELVT